MIELSALERKRIKLVNGNGQTFEGIVGDYIYPEDNVPQEIEAIIVNCPTRGDGFKYENPVEFTASEIKSIEII